MAEKWHNCASCQHGAASARKGCAGAKKRLLRSHYEMANTLIPISNSSYEKF